MVRILLVNAAVLVAAMVAVVRFFLPYVWRRNTRRAGLPCVDLAELRAEHAAQILADAATDPALDAALARVQRQIVARYGRLWWWRWRSVRRMFLGGYAATVVAAATEPGARIPAGFGPYSYPRLVVAAAVHLGERSRRGARWPGGTVAR